MLWTELLVRGQRVLARKPADRRIDMIENSY